MELSVAMKGMRHPAKRISVYKKTCRRVNSLPWVTGSMGRPDLRWSSTRYSASVQKMRQGPQEDDEKQNQRFGPDIPVMEDQPSTGGMAPRHRQ